MSGESKPLKKTLLFRGSKRPTAQKLKSRKTTITNAFVLSILPVIDPTDEEFLVALEVLGLDPNDIRCVYCGDPTHGWDHLRPVVRNLRPTGYITEIANLVPACGKCNSSKGGAPWKTWMQSTTAKGSPTRRSVPDIEERIARLEQFEQWRQPIWIDFDAIIGRDEMEGYWQLRQDLIDQMMRCQAVADRILERVERHLVARGK